MESIFMAIKPTVLTVWVWGLVEFIECALSAILAPSRRKIKFKF